MSRVLEFEEVAHLFALGAKVGNAGIEDVGEAGDSFHDLDAGLFDRFDFFGVVRHQADGLQTEELEDGTGKFVIAEVAVEAELLVGLDGVGALVL